MGSWPDDIGRHSHPGIVAMTSSQDFQERLGRALASRYRIEGEIGHGGMATVFRALDLRHDRWVAVKVLDPSLAQVLGAERFLREIRTVARLTHPNILPLHDSGEADGLLYYVMPFVEGESLQQRLAREKQLPVEDAVQIAREVAEALAYAHERGVIHRDVKPGNILLEAGHAVLADFGVAQAVTKSEEEPLTRTGMSLGTPSYTSPEQAIGDRALDGRSDQYALGCVLYEMLTGQPPFTGSQVESVIRQHLTSSPPPVTQVRTTVPTRVAGALTRALAKSPADRYRTTADFAAALAFAETQPEGPDQPRRGPVGWRARFLISAAAVVVVMGFSVWRWTGSRGPSMRPEGAHRVMVLPFDNQTGDPELEPVGRMVAEWITEGLARTGEVQVVPSLMVLESLARVQEEEGDAGGRDVLQVAEATESGIAVTGAYYRQGQELVIHSEVVDLTSDRSLGAVEAVRGPISDPGAAIQAVRERVMGVLATRLRPGTAWEVPPSVQPPTYEAFRLYSNGTRYWLQGRYREAGEWFQKAYEADTTFLRSLLIAGGARGNAGDLRGEDSILRAIEPRRGELAPYDRYRLEFGAAGLRGDLAAQLRAGRAGTALVPNGTLHLALILSLRENNLPREALESLEGIREDVMAVFPVWYPLWDMHTEILHLLERHERELEVAREARAVAPATPDFLELEARALAALGRTEELRSVVEEIVVAPEVPGATAPQVLLSVAEELRAHGHAESSVTIAGEGLAYLERNAPSPSVGSADREIEGRLLYLNERWEEAGRIFSGPGVESTPRFTTLGLQGVAAARLGDQASAGAMDRRLGALDEPFQRGANTLWRARIQAVLGNRDEAVSLLRRAFAEGVGFGIWLHRDVDLEPLRGYPPFEELIRPKG